MMETKQIINGLLDRADRVADQSAGRIMKQAAERLRELDQKQKWIPVTERLPALHTNDYKEPDDSRTQFEVSDDQWVITEYGYQTQARYEKWDRFEIWVEYFGNTLQDVTHWMPLPEAPKEVDHESES